MFLDLIIKSMMLINMSLLFNNTYKDELVTSVFETNENNYSIVTATNLTADKYQTENEYTTSINSTINSFDSYQDYYYFKVTTNSDVIVSVHSPNELNSLNFYFIKMIIIGLMMNFIKA